ncbi:MAG: hypothetical protein IT232_08565 [Flavobacteriales bacterium]|nr:hypothetical protein [Flavobacteriales bacterium]
MPLDYNSTLLVGRYKLHLKSSLIPSDWLASIIETFKGLIGWGIEVVEGKPIKIISAKAVKKNNADYVELEFDLLKNPVPVAAIVLAILGVLGVFGAFLTFDSIEEITSNPVIGTGVGLGVILLVVVGVVWFAGNYKKIFSGEF